MLESDTSPDEHFWDPMPEKRYNSFASEAINMELPFHMWCEIFWYHTHVWNSNIINSIKSIIQVWSGSILMYYEDSYVITTSQKRLCTWKS